jgi:hypothetical protein
MGKKATYGAHAASITQLGPEDIHRDALFAMRLANHVKVCQLHGMALHDSEQQRAAWFVSRHYNIISLHGKVARKVWGGSCPTTRAAPSTLKLAD